MNNYKPVIGLEIHVELKTKSKMFCQCSADYFEKPPNSNTCPVCLGMPGALPVPNKTAIDWVVKLGLALGCSINILSKFDRKHYSYPDLPKGYQISQFDEPFAVNGSLEIINNNLKEKKIFRIHRIHLEEDTGKLLHMEGETRIDFNRSSVPLVEIVTEPDFQNSDDVKLFLEELHTIVRYLDISDADMEKGSMRMEPNISVRKVLNPQNADEKFELPSYKVEVKNINSFRFVKQAIDYEVKRHIEIFEKGEIPPQETRGFDEKKVSTYSQRVKEEAADYRYFPDPDIPPIRLTEKDIAEIKNHLPELPDLKLKRFMSDFQIKYEDAFIITREKKTAELYEEVIKFVNSKGIDAQKTVNWIINKNNRNLSKELLIEEIINSLTPKETDANLLDEVGKRVIANNQKVVADITSGKGNAIMFLVGQVMKEMKGQANAQDVKAKLESLIK